MWRAILELAEAMSSGWTLVGAQMVALHGFEHNRASPRASLDADVLVNVRIAGVSTRKFCARLESLGYELDGVSPEGLGHRFRGPELALDVLAPDGLPPRTRLTTQGGARTLSIPGGTQALARTRRVEVALGKTRGEIPRPDLLGALLLKARAVEVDDVPDAQRSDLAFLLSLVPDPRSLRTQLKATERGWLRRRSELLEPRAPAWRGLAPEVAENGRLALAVLTAT
jgi:hypothetical protein